MIPAMLVVATTSIFMMVAMMVIPPRNKAAITVSFSRVLVFI
jgi:hypothetical protein